MNDNRMKRWMDAIDDDLLEEAQRPLPRGGAARRWGALAACFCAAALALALWQPWSAGIGDNTAGADADFGAMDKSLSVAMPPVLDAEPLSSGDAATLKEIGGGSYSWRRRAILVKYNGHVYAASMNTMPHGEDSIPGNDFDGHFCIHFYKSKTHETNRVDGDHQRAVTRAMNASW